MNQPICVVVDCGRPSPDTYLCPRCADHLEKLLAELPALLRDLEVTISRQANAGRPEQTQRGKPGTTVLYDPGDHASRLADEARMGLSTWVRHLCEQRGYPQPYLMTARSMAVWLTSHVSAIAADEAAGDCYARMQELRHAISRAIDNLAKVLAGQCTATIKALDLAVHGADLAVGYLERPCDAILRTRHGDRMIRCDECGTEYDAVEVWVANLERAREQHLTAEDCARLITRARLGHVTEPQIRKLTSRGKLFSYRDDEVGRPLYLLGELLDLLARDDRKVSA